MNRIAGLFTDAFAAARRRKNLITFFVLTHVVFLLLGQWMMHKGIPGVVQLREEQLKMIKDLPYLKPLTGALADSVALKILYTFFFNLVFGAFISTTLMGAVFFLPYLTAVWRSFVIGILFYGLEDMTTLKIIVFYGTFVLEFGAYCISSAVGTDLGLTLIWPARKKTDKRKDALRIAIKDGMRLYLLVIVILFVAAIWEIGWLEYLGPFVKPDVAAR